MRINIPVYYNAPDLEKYTTRNPKCVNSNIYTGHIFVAACPRSGTLYMAKVLQALGYDVSHEGIGKDGTVGWNMVAANPKNCFHQVRNPLKQIASMGVLQEWNMIDKLMIAKPKELRHRMSYWLQWNNLCEDICVWQYRIEELPDVWEEFLERIGHKRYEPIPPVPTNTNSRKHKDLAWDNLFECDEELTKEIQEKAIMYGYTIELPQGKSKIVLSRLG